MSKNKKEPLIKLLNNGNGTFYCHKQGKKFTFTPNAIEEFLLDEAKILIKYPNMVDIEKAIAAFDAVDVTEKVEIKNNAS